MNCENSETLLLNLSDKINLKRNNKYVALSSLSTYYTRIINKFKILAPTWNDKFEFADGSYQILSVQDIQDYFEYIIKKHGEKTGIPPIRIYVNKIENWITFRIKTKYLKLLTPETIKLLALKGK